MTQTVAVRLVIVNRSCPARDPSCPNLLKRRNI
jgi:hypothetical protein